MELKEIFDKVIPNSNGIECLEILLCHNFQEQKNNYLALANLLGNTTLCTALINRGADLLASDPFSNNLPIASQIKDIELYKYAVEQIDDINRFDLKKDFNLLLSACFEGNIQKVEYLISKGANINVSNYQGITPFYDACKKGDVDIIKCLIANRVENLYDSNINNKSPISVALVKNNFVVVEYLLEIGYDISKLTDLYEFLSIVAMIKNYRISKLVGEYYLDYSTIKYVKTESMELLKLRLALEIKPNFLEQILYLYYCGYTDESTFGLMTTYNAHDPESSYSREERRKNKKILFEKEIAPEYIETVVVKYFENAYRTYTFLSNGLNCKPGDRVIVETSGKEQVVIVVSGNKKEDKSKFNYELKKIKRKL